MYQFSVFVHLVSAIVWVGGMLFVALVAVPAIRPLPAAERAELLGSLGRRFRLVGWIAIALLIVTGVINSGLRGVTWESVASGQLLASRFGQLLAAKLILAAVMLVLSVMHDLVIGPASVRALEHPDSADAQEVGRLRQQASWMARANAALAVLVVGLAVGLVRGLPW